MHMPASANSQGAHFKHLHSPLPCSLQCFSEINNLSKSSVLHFWKLSWRWAASPFWGYEEWAKPGKTLRSENETTWRHTGYVQRFQDVPEGHKLLIHELRLIKASKCHVGPIKNWQKSRFTPQQTSGSMFLCICQVAFQRKASRWSILPSVIYSSLLLMAAEPSLSVM